MSDKPMTAQLAQWIRAFDYDGVPDHVIELVKVSLLDALGGAFAATTHSEAAGNALAILEHFGDSNACTVIGQDRRLPMIDAVFANGMLIRALDFNDYLPRDPNDGATLGSHPSDNMAIGLAVGEQQEVSGRDFLAAMVMGYELNGRLIKLFDTDSDWDNTTTTGLVSPAIAGRLMNLDQERLTSAIAFSLAHATSHKSVRRGHISAAKFLADPIVAKNGVFATLLAAGGVPGPIEVFDGSFGLGQAVFSRGELSSLVRPLDKFYIFEGVCIKAYPIFANSQAAVSAAIEVKKAFKGSPDEITAIGMTMADVPAVTSQLDDVSRRYPKNQETADHSFHFAVAVALIDGEVTLRSFENNRWEDPQVKALIDMIDIVPDKAWNTREHSGAPASIEVTTRDGQTYAAEVAYQRGHVKNRMGADGISEKFLSSVKDIVDPKRSAAIIDAVMTLERQKSLKPLMALLGGR
jgi:2-methylcitrate dehydratase